MLNSSIDCMQWSKKMSSRKRDFARDATMSLDKKIKQGKKFFVTPSFFLLVLFYLVHLVDFHHCVLGFHGTPGVLHLTMVQLVYIFLLFALDECSVGWMRAAKFATGCLLCFSFFKFCFLLIIWISGDATLRVGILRYVSANLHLGMLNSVIYNYATYPMHLVFFLLDIFFEYMVFARIRDLLDLCLLRKKLQNAINEAGHEKKNAPVFHV